MTVSIGDKHGTNCQKIESSIKFKNKHTACIADKHNVEDSGHLSIILLHSNEDKVKWKLTENPDFVCL